MLRILNEESWNRALENDPKLKDLATKAGIVNNYERAKELNGCFALNCGDDVVNSEAERELARYMFCVTDENSMQTSLQGRYLAARSAGIGINNL